MRTSQRLPLYFHVRPRAEGNQSRAATVCLETTFLPAEKSLLPLGKKTIVDQPDSIAVLIFSSVSSKKKKKNSQHGNRFLIIAVASKLARGRRQEKKMDIDNSEEATITVILKTPNQAFQDQTVEGVHLNWTVKDLKTHLSMVYPSRPVSTPLS